ncbi:putative TPR-like protein [Rosellinia necatrix]|uniref:Putative TPR-like protein n=1 Tax=Rosellinia necatrix TaxID=77044 RepID=A0A1W2TWT1_ROSNE|nr:putative TPR-like protein [Rosellinia necatrix]
MRLLTRHDPGSFDLTDYPAGSTIPPYAILSHRWGPEEVTYEDLKHGTGPRKLGYHKIRFCAEQAGRDGLRHFWLDTCCIDKSSSAELTESINSMFHWYGNATRCYAYLEDVSCTANPDTTQQGRAAWHASFQSSLWFTRGWTLQELVAPTTVDFFSKEGEKLGNKASLEHLICTTTGIPARALRGSLLSNFSVAERMAWAEGRETTRPEDRAYSLLGIFGVHMPLIYGEGEEKAMSRLRDEITKDQKGSQHEDFSVPFSLYAVPEIQHFVAREQELAEMRERLRSDGRRQAVVLYGLGGMGKTQLAIAYTKRHHDNYSSVFWLNIKDENSLHQSFARVADQIKRQHPSARYISGLDTQNDLNDTVNAVKAWLSLPRNSRWLLVYDNYDNPKLQSNPDPAAIDIQKYLPESYQGAIIITTRSSQVKIGHAIRMSKLRNLNDSLEILTTTSKREGLADDPDAIDLAKRLDGLPLALTTAGAYLEQTSTTFRSYLRLYEESWAKLQTSSPELTPYEDRTLYSTWQLSFDQIQRRNEHSAALLRLWAYFDSQDLWLELLQHHGPDSPQWILEVTKDELSFHRTVQILSEHGLVEVNEPIHDLLESRGYSVHSCVHSWMASVLNPEPSRSLATFAIQCIASHLPRPGSSRWRIKQRRLLQHAERYSYPILNTIIDDESSWIFNNFGVLYRDQGKLGEAEEMYNRALQSYLKAFGPNHTSTLELVNNLGLLYRDQGRLKEAEGMYNWALQSYLKAFGPNHVSTLELVNNLGVLYKEQERLENAEGMYNWALQSYEKSLGPNHISTLELVNNLGVLYKSQGKMKEAEEMYNRAIQGYEKVLGPDHTSTLETANNLGVLYKDQGKLEEAEEMYNRALQSHERELGPYHRSTLDTVNNLGVLYKIQGKPKEAEEMYNRALQGYEKALGPDHILTLKSLNNLGVLYLHQNRLKEAGEMFGRAFRGFQTTYGPDHPNTLRVLKNLQRLATSSTSTAN